MVFVQRQANWGARSGASAYKDDEKPRKHGTAERPYPLTQVDRSSLRKSTATAIDGESSTTDLFLELAEAHGLTVVAVTTDEELRGALIELLPEESLVFSDSPEQVLSRSVPNNCAVLIVEQSVNTPIFERLKSHLKASSPALVNIMVGTHNDGSSLVGLLSAGCIDRMMMKPLKPGPTRSALRSALQQHHSLRLRVQVDRAKLAPATESVRDAAPTQAARRTSDVPVCRSALPKSHADSQRHVEQVRQVHDAEQLKDALRGDQTGAFENERERAAAELVVPSHVEAVLPSAAGPRQLSPSWSLVFAAMIAVVGLIASGVFAWGISMRAPDVSEVNVNQALIDKAVAGHLAAAQSAFEIGSYVDPPELSATHFYNAVLELDPLNAQAKRGLEAVGDELIANSKQLISAGDLLRAQSALDSVRRVQPRHRELAAVTASLLKARETERLTIQAAHSAATPTLAPIAVAASPLVSGKPSAKLESTGKSAQRMASENKTDSSLTVFKTAPQPRAMQVTQTQMNPESLVPVPAANHVNEAKIVASAQDEGAVRSVPKVAAAETVATELGHSAATAPISANAVANTPESPRAEPTSAEPSSAATNTVHSKPALLKYVAPVYPYKARGENVEGWLDVHFVVTSEGNVIAPHVERGTLDSRFHRAALAAVTQWKFAPSSNGTRPNRTIEVRLEFKLID